MANKLNVPEEVLFRQIHPNSLQQGEPGSDRFRPSEMDANQLSTDRSTLTSAAAAHALYTSTGKKSAAVFGLTVSEFQNESIVCIEDPVKNRPGLPDNPAHALADYSQHELNKQKIIAKRLKRLAVERGCLHLPASSAYVDLNSTGYATNTALKTDLFSPQAVCGLSSSDG